METGKTLYVRPKAQLGQVVAPQYVTMMNAMMQETLLTGTARKAALPGWPAAGKTGTSQDFRDAWFIGYTSQLVTGVWLGNDDSSPTRKATGGGLPVDVWSRFMRAAHSGVPVAALPNGAGARAASADGPTAPTLPPGSIPAPQTVAAPGRGQPQAGSLDGWFIDRLFGRR
jgi:penicillin-binding protein 1A